MPTSSPGRYGWAIAPPLTKIHGAALRSPEIVLFDILYQSLCLSEQNSGSYIRDVTQFVKRGIIIAKKPIRRLSLIHI